MSRLDIKTASKAQTVVDRLYKDMERRIASSPPGLCPIDMSLTFLQLCHAQSCGKCVPCRIGLGQLSILMGQVLDGTGTMLTIDTIEKTARAIVASADCAIGRDAAQLVLSGFEGFRDDYVNHVQHHRCLASLQNPVPCVSLCPAGVDVPGYVALVREGRYADAVRLIRKDNPMPTACAYICEHPCEARCRRNMVDAPVNIRGLKRYAVDHAGNVPNPACGEATGKRVAIIGGGPSGLSCAYYLRLMGHSVTIFEEKKRLGGMLRYGIPDFKLDKSLIDRRIAQMENEGVQFRCSTSIGVPDHPHGIWNDSERTIDVSELLRDFSVVVLAVGSETPRDLQVKGRDLKGIHFALEYLPVQNKHNASEPFDEDISAKDRKVLIIGGGDTGSDCLGTAIRQGAEKVLQIDLGPKPPETYDKSMVWPNWPAVMRTSTSQEEGGERDYAISTKEFLSDGEGRVRGVKAVRLEWMKDPVTGRRTFKEIPDSEFEIESDLVLLAMGFLHPSSPVMDAFGVQTDMRGNAQAAYEGKDAFRTNVPKVFAAGDCRRGQSLVVRALAEGRRCAEAVDKFLSDEQN